MATERRDFTDEEILTIWNKAAKVAGKDPEKWRKDYAGALMWWPKYGDRNSQYGWEIDHRKPLSLGGTYNLSNLDALQWENNMHKSDNYPKWQTNRTYDGIRNIEYIRNWHVE